MQLKSLMVNILRSRSQRKAETYTSISKGSFPYHWQYKQMPIINLSGQCLAVKVICQTLAIFSRSTVQKINTYVYHHFFYCQPALMTISTCILGDDASQNNLMKPYSRICMSKEKRISKERRVVKKMRLRYTYCVMLNERNIEDILFNRQ